MPPYTDMTPTLRVAEQRALYRVLADRRPAVVLVCGTPGMGKSWLLRRLRARATSQGWHVASDLDGGVLRIDPQTPPRAFRSAVLDAIKTEAGDDRSRIRRETAMADPQAPSRPLDPFVEELARHAPLLVVVDDYRPGAAFGRWFQTAFLPQVPRCGASLVVAVAQPPGGGELAPLATVPPVELSELAPEEIRVVLQHDTAHVEPPLSDEELDVYAREARNPQDLGSLIRALTFTAGRPEESL